MSRKGSNNLPNDHPFAGSPYIPAASSASQLVPESLSLPEINIKKVEDYLNKRKEEYAIGANREVCIKVTLCEVVLTEHDRFEIQLNISIGKDIHGWAVYRLVQEVLPVMPPSCDTAWVVDTQNRKKIIITFSCLTINDLKKNIETIEGRAISTLGGNWDNDGFSWDDDSYLVPASSAASASQLVVTPTILPELNSKKVQQTLVDRILENPLINIHDIRVISCKVIQDINQFKIELSISAKFAALSYWFHPSNFQSNLLPSSIPDTSIISNQTKGKDPSFADIIITCLTQEALVEMVKQLQQAPQPSSNNLSTAASSVDSLPDPSWEQSWLGSRYQYGFDGERYSFMEQLWRNLLSTQTIDSTATLKGLAKNIQHVVVDTIKKNIQGHPKVSVEFNDSSMSFACATDTVQLNLGNYLQRSIKGSKEIKLNYEEIEKTDITPSGFSKRVCYFYCKLDFPNWPSALTFLLFLAEVDKDVVEGHYNNFLRESYDASSSATSATPERQIQLQPTQGLSLDRFVETLPLVERPATINTSSTLVNEYDWYDVILCIFSDSNLGLRLLNIYSLVGSNSHYLSVGWKEPSFLTSSKSESELLKAFIAFFVERITRGKTLSEKILIASRVEQMAIGLRLNKREVQLYFKTKEDLALFLEFFFPRAEFSRFIDARLAPVPVFLRFTSDELLQFARFLKTVQPQNQIEFDILDKINDVLMGNEGCANPANLKSVKLPTSQGEILRAILNRGNLNDLAGKLMIRLEAVQVGGLQFRKTGDRCRDVIKESSFPQDPHSKMPQQCDEIREVLLGKKLVESEEPPQKNAIAPSASHPADSVARYSAGASASSTPQTRYSMFSSNTTPQTSGIQPMDNLIDYLRQGIEAALGGRDQEAIDPLKKAFYLIQNNPPLLEKIRTSDVSITERLPIRTFNLTNLANKIAELYKKLGDLDNLNEAIVWYSTAAKEGSRSAPGAIQEVRTLINEKYPTNKSVLYF